MQSDTMLPVIRGGIKKRRNATKAKPLDSDGRGALIRVNNKKQLKMNKYRSKKRQFLSIFR